MSVFALLVASGGHPKGPAVTGRRRRGADLTPSGHTIKLYYIYIYIYRDR